MIPVLLTPVLVFLVFFALHWIPFRLRPIQARTRALTLTLLLCALLLLLPVYRLLCRRIPSLPLEWEIAAAVVFAGLLFTLLWCGYVQFYFSFDTSPSLRFLVEFLESGKSELTPDELKARFDFNDTYQRRIQRAVDGKAILTIRENENLFFRNSKKGEFWAAIGIHFKQFMKLGSGG